MSRTDALFWCARLNLLDADPSLDVRTKQQQFLEIFFLPNQIEAVNRFAETHGGTDNVIAMNRGAVLELIRWICLLCHDHAEDGVTFEKPQAREDFTRALLMANEFWAQRVYGDAPFEGTSIDEKRENALAPIRHSLSETRHHQRVYEAVARGKVTFGQIFSEYRADFFSEFFDNTGLAVDEYYLCLCVLVAHCLNSEAKSGVGGKNNPGIFTLKNISDPAPHMEGLFGRFLRLLSVTSEELAEAFWSDNPVEPVGFEYNYSLLPLRQRPILRAGDGRMIILDPACFIEKASVGPLFNLSIKAKEDNRLSEFGQAFEDYVGSVLQRIYPDPGPYLAKRLHSNVREVKKPGEIQVADFIVDDVSNIVVIEAKAVWLKDEKIRDPMAFVEHLRSRYGADQRPVGCRQLARNVSKIASREWYPLGVELTDVRRVFPVLLVHDELLDAPVFGHFLAKEFSHSLKADSMDGSGWSKEISGWRL